MSYINSAISWYFGADPVGAILFESVRLYKINHSHFFFAESDQQFQREGVAGDACIGRTIVSAVDRWTRGADKRLVPSIGCGCKNKDFPLVC